MRIVEPDIHTLTRDSGLRPILVYSPHPLMPGRDRELIYAEFLPGESIAQYLVRSGLAARLGRRPLVCTINGHQVPRALWTRCRPKPGTLINLYAVVRGGGGGGKNPLASVATIALMIWAPEIAVAIGGTAAGTASALTLTGRLIATGASIVGGMAVNALFPPPKPQLSQAQGQTGAAQESPTYSLSGGQNAARPYAPMPVIMGSHRVFADLGAKPYTEFEGEDQYLYQVFDFGYNDVDLSTYHIGTNPIENFEAVTIQESGPDGALTLFPCNVDTQEGAALTAASGAILRTSSPNTTALAVDLVGSQYQVASNGTIGAGVPREFSLSYRAVGDAAWIAFDAGGNPVTLDHGDRRPARLTWRVEVPLGQYEVQVQRVSADETDPQIVCEYQWTQLRSYQPDTADYTGRRRVALKIKASGQLNGTVAQFSAVARAKCLAWSGAAWVTAQTSNPAWWFLATARGVTAAGRRVWGAGIADARIDLEALKAFGTWCDSKNLSFNGVFDQPISVYDMLSAIALCGRGTLSWASGKLSVVWDAPDQPTVAVFGMSNILAGSFEIDYATEQLADEILLSFINPDLDWQRDTVRVTVPGVTTPVRTRNIELFGCTGKDMAGRAANLYAATNAYRNRRYKWHSDFEAMPAARGSVVQLSHDLASLDYSGRLIEGGSNAVLKLERKVPLYGGGAFVILVAPDQSFAAHDVAGGAGDTDTLNLVTPLGYDPCANPDHPPYDYKWLYGPSATPGKAVKIDSLRPLDERTVEVTAVDELAIFYSSENDPYTYVPPRPVFGSGATASNLALVENGVRAAKGYAVNVTATWDAGSDYSYADLRLSVDGAPFDLRGQEIRARSFEFTVSDGSEITVELLAYGSLGRLGQATRLAASRAVNFAAVAPPGNIQRFTLEGGTFSWPESPEVDVLGYRIRFHYGERRSFADATPLHEGLLTSSPYTPAVLPAGLATFLIVAEDVAGLQSPEAAAIVQDLGDAPIANVVETIDFQAEGWPGTLTHCTVSAGNVIADSGVAFYSEDGGAPMYGNDSDPFYDLDMYRAMSYESDGIAIGSALAGSRMTLDAAVAGEAITIEYRSTGPGPIYGTDAEPFYGADADPFYDAPPGYSAWPGAIVVANGEYQIRVGAGESVVQGVISTLTATIDAPDLEESINDLVIALGGTRAPLTKPFTAIKNIQVTLEDDGGTAVGVRILDKDAVLGPLLKCVDDAGGYVAGKIDARIKGY